MPKPIAALHKLVRTSFKKGFVDLLSANFMVQFLGFGTLLLIPRFVSAAALGEIKIIQTYANLFLLLGLFGFNSSILKLCSEQRTDDERNYLLKVALKRMGLTTVIAYGLLVLLSSSGLLSSSPQLSYWLPIYGLILPFSAATMLFSAHLQALKRIKAMARAQLLVKVQSVVLIVVATWQFGLAGFMVSTVLAYAIGLWPFLKQVGRGFLKAPPHEVPKLFMNMAVYNVLSNAVYRIGKRADFYVLGLFMIDTTEIGYYSLAVIFLAGAGVFTGTVQTIVMPYFSERADDEAWFRSKLFKTQLQTTLLSIAVAGLVRVGAWVVIEVMYDPAYLAALKYLDVLLIYHVLRSSYAVLGTSLLSLGLPKYNFYSACFTTPISLAATYGALVYFGAIGVAWAQVFSGFITLGAHVAIVLYALQKYYAPRPPAQMV